MSNANATRAVIDLDALRHNVSRLAGIAAPAAVMLAVKADAYGHGLLPIARAGLEAGAQALAVLEIPAGLVLRRAGVRAPLFAWLHGSATDFRAGIEAEIELGISAVWQLEAIEATAADRPAVVHLKLDSGLSRNGATIEQWPELVRAALEAERRGVLRVRGVWSHLADASVHEDEQALAVFTEAVALAEGLGARFEVKHLAASSAGIRMPEARFDYVRFGIAAYGISPFDDRSGADLGLLPVMSLLTDVVAVDRTAGTARIAAGFADGVHTHVTGAASVQVNGERLRINSVDVDGTTIEASPEIGVGDTAVVFGQGARGEPTAEEWAGWAETVGDEIVTHIPARVARSYLGSD